MPTRHEDIERLGRMQGQAPLLLGACEAAEHWLAEELANPGQAVPGEILRVLRHAIAMATFPVRCHACRNANVVDATHCRACGAHLKGSEQPGDDD